MGGEKTRKKYNVEKNSFILFYKGYVVETSSLYSLCTTFKRACNARAVACLPQKKGEKNQKEEVNP